ncbi:MAG: efflux RND transporter periplasmic adaptor subunit [Myxococcota bacterium]
MRLYPTRFWAQYAWTALAVLTLATLPVVTSCSDQGAQASSSDKEGDNGPGSGKEGDDQGSAKEQAVPVYVQAAIRGEIANTLLATTQATARFEVRILSETTGNTDKVTVEEGDQVTRNQVLARLSNPESSIALSTARANAARLRRELAQLKPLIDKGYVARQTYDEMQFQLTQARDQVAQLGAQVADLTVRTPIDGVVASRSLIRGQQVTPGQELFYIVDPSQLEAIIYVPERSLGRINEGDPAYAISDALGGVRFPGSIRLISPVVDPQTGTVKVTVTLDQTTQNDPQGRAMTLRAGMFVSVYLITDQRSDAILIPKRAVLYEDDNPYVYVIRAQDGVDKASKQRLTLGFTEQGRVEVTRGVASGERVVTIGQAGLKDSTEVSIVERQQQPQTPDPSAPP